MYPQQRKPRTITIGPREALIGLGVLMTVAVGLTILIFGVGSVGSADATAVAQDVPTPTATPAERLPTPTPIPATPQPTDVLAPTIAPTPEVTVHTVQEGETLTSIAILYGVTIETILEANGLNSDVVIWSGQQLDIPLIPGEAGAYHEVQEGETLSIIGDQYGVTSDAISRANNLASPDSIFVGQRLYIPGATVPESTPIPEVTRTEASEPTPEAHGEALDDGPRLSEWPRSLLDGDLASNYPLTYNHDRFMLHYQPGTAVEEQLPVVVAFAEIGLGNAERTLGVRLSGSFDIYVAGTLFETPNGDLRGLSRSADRRVFILYDGTGTPADNAYFFSHEITHLVAWNTYGQPSSTMLSEGLATYAGRDELEQGGYVSYDQLCAAIRAAGEMPSMAAINTDWQQFQGHIRNPFEYFGSGCFVGWLIDQYGVEPLSDLYHTSDYANLYGMSLQSLDASWNAYLDSRPPSLTLDPAQLVTYTGRVGTAYDYVFANYNGTDIMHLAYAMVDRARIALWQGDFAETQRWLDEFTALTGYAP